MRLPPLKRLRVHNPKREVENPCLAIMSSVLGAPISSSDPSSSQRVFGENTFLANYR